MTVCWISLAQTAGDSSRTASTISTAQEQVFVAVAGFVSYIQASWFRTENILTWNILKLYIWIYLKHFETGFPGICSAKVGDWGLQA